VVVIVVDILCFLVLIGASVMTLVFAGTDVTVVEALALLMVAAS
jgi:hypothetical protein